MAFTIPIFEVKKETEAKKKPRPNGTICQKQSNQAFGLNCPDKQIEGEAKYALH